MITRKYVRTLAAYNRWQNKSIYGAAATLSDADRRKDRGAFFKSIHGTLNHVLWGDQMWMARFANTAEPDVLSIPESPQLIEDFDALRSERTRFDQVIAEWCASVDDSWFNEDLTWVSGAAGKTVTRPRGMLVVHMFNHQTHHRGQVHAMLTAAGATPDDTDLPFGDID